MRTAASLLLAAALGLPQDPPAADTGSLEGTVTLPPKPPPKIRKNPYPGARPPGEYLRGPAVVFLDGVAGDFKPQKKEELEQKNRQFVKLALPILKGTTVSFPNRDDEYHNVFSRSRTKELELGRYGTNESKEETFDKPGLVRLRCEIHSNMHAVILVLENPFFAVCDPQGRYSIAGVPPGKYKLYAFHEEYEPKDEQADPMRAVGRDVEVTKGGVVKTDFDLGAK